MDMHSTFYDVPDSVLFTFGRQSSTRVTRGHVCPVSSHVPSSLSRILPLYSFGEVLAEDHCIVALGPGPGLDHTHRGISEWKLLKYSINGCWWVG